MSELNQDEEYEQNAEVIKYLPSFFRHRSSNIMIGQFYNLTRFVS